MALGEILKNARVQRGLTPSDVAENTHLMVQVVEDLEREDFRRVAAPIYGRGFIKLYAELLELDPEPLIRDFMDLYTGGRAPAVRTKKVESPVEPATDPVPVTRTVSGPAPLSPQRQAVQPRPAVRPLSVPQPVAQEAASDQPEEARERPAVTVPGPVPVLQEEKAFEEEPEPLQQASEGGVGLVVESEDVAGESDEPDLFRPQSLRRKPRAEVTAEEDELSQEEPRARKPKLPIFKIGGRMAEEPQGHAEQDEASHARRRARIQAFVDGVTKLKEGVERKLPSTLPQKQLVALGGLGVAALVFMAVGIHFLFKMTGSNVKETAGAIVKTVAPPPDLYVD
jgi:cytoskeleton protein RodZ